MFESQSLHRRYLTYLLLFYCVALTLYCWFPVLSSARSRFLLNTQTPLQSSQNTTIPQNVTAIDPNFPLRIWQTARTNLPSQAPQIQSQIQSWLDKNPSHIYTLITAARGLSYAQTHYSDRPDLLSAFQSLQDPMLRADLVQYLFLLQDGGIYTDLDTICLKPISEWIPPQYDIKDIGLVLGIEGDALGGPIIAGFSHPVQFATWTMAVKPNHFMTEMIIARVLSQLHALAERQNTTISGIEADYMDVMDTTGPGVFAESIYAGLSQITNTTVTSANLTRMTQPRLFGDVLILPITSFGAGLGHSNAGGVDDEMALVQHLFAGSWKGDHKMGGGKTQNEDEEELDEEEEEAVREGSGNEGGGEMEDLKVSKPRRRRR